MGLPGCKWLFMLMAAAAVQKCENHISEGVNGLNLLNSVLRTSSVIIEGAGKRKPQI
jgi:hypothetical protein